MALNPTLTPQTLSYFAITRRRYHHRYLYDVLFKGTRIATLATRLEAKRYIQLAMGMFDPATPEQLWQAWHGHAPWSK